MKFPETVKGIRPMTDFEKTYQNYNPRQAALDEARALLTAAAKAAMADGTLPEAELPAFIVEIPADVKNGDIASNLAMAGARTWRKAPKMIADALLAHLPSLENSVFSKVEVAGPGFINLFLSQSFWAGVVLGACANKEYGRTDHGKGAKYNVEFVSANPTGPMHMGNARSISTTPATRSRSSAKVWRCATCSSSAARRPIPCPRSAIRAAISRCWPVSLPS